MSLLEMNGIMLPHLFLSGPFSYLCLSDHLLFLSDLLFLSFLCPWHPYLGPSDVILALFAFSFGVLDPINV